MRVSIVAPQIARYDAIGNHIVFQARALARRGFSVRIFYDQFADAPLDLTPWLERVDFPRLPDRRQLELFNTSRLAIFHYPMHYDLFDWILRPFAGTKVVDYHGLTPARLWHGDAYAALRAHAAKRVLVRHADHAIAHSRFARDELVASSGFPADRIHLLGYAVPLERFESAADANSGAGPAALLYVGRMAPNKRIDVLVEALAHLPADSHLTLAGDGEFLDYRRTLDEALARARALGIEPRVRYLPPVSDEELPQLFAACNVYVTASEHEGFCVPVIEAMATGRPVVATSAAALPETIGDAGVLVPPGDARALARGVERVLGDASFRAELVERGRRRSREFSPEHQTVQLLNWLEAIGIGPPTVPTSVSLELEVAESRSRPSNGLRELTVRVRNNGPGDLVDGEIRADWQSEDGLPLARGAALERLAQSLPAGTTGTVRSEVALPGRAGCYRLEVSASGAGGAVSLGRVHAILDVAEPEAAAIKATDDLARLRSAARRPIPVYRDFTFRRGLWRIGAWLRRNFTRHVVRHHVDPIARWQAEIQIGLSDELARLGSRIAAECATRAAERLEATRTIDELRRRIEQLERRARPRVDA